MAIEHWMSWEAGVDLIGMIGDNTGNAMPNVILHVARMVHTPVGSAPSGMVFWQPDPQAPPQIAGFISENSTVGAYFGPHIFAGTPFENAPVLDATIEISTGDASASARVTIKAPTGEMVFESQLSDWDELQIVHRGAGTDGSMMPFAQQGLEARARTATLKVNGEEVTLTLPEATMSGAPAATWAPTGLYAR